MRFGLAVLKLRCAWAWAPVQNGPRGLPTAAIVLKEDLRLRAGWTSNTQCVATVWRPHLQTHAGLNAALMRNADHGVWCRTAAGPPWPVGRRWPGLGKQW